MRFEISRIIIPKMTPIIRNVIFSILTLLLSIFISNNVILKYQGILPETQQQTSQVNPHFTPSHTPGPAAGGSSSSKFA